jgi:hypothetical protein
MAEDECSQDKPIVSSWSRPNAMPCKKANSNRVSRQNDGDRSNAHRKLFGVKQGHKDIRSRTISNVVKDLHHNFPMELGDLLCVMGE